MVTIRFDGKTLRGVIGTRVLQASVHNFLIREVALVGNFPTKRRDLISMVVFTQRAGRTKRLTRMKTNATRPSSYSNSRTRIYQH